MMPPEKFLIFLPMDALMFPLLEYVIKLIPSLVTFRSKEGQTQAPMGNTDLNLYVSRNSAFSPKLHPRRFLKTNILSTNV